MKQITFLSLFLCFLFSYSQGGQINTPHMHHFTSNAPTNCIASPYSVMITQPDQTQLTIIGKGTMINSRTESIDGYTLVKNANGVYEYAKLKNGNLHASGIKANDPTNRAAVETAYISSLQTSIQAAPNPLKTSILNQVRKKILNKSFPTSGNIRVLALLIDFPDLQHTYTKANFDSLLNGLNYNNGKGSFKTYYDNASNGQLSITVDLMGWIRADSSYIYYGKDSGATRAADLVREAVDSAEIIGVNFANYDNDNDGYVDGIIAIHAGQGAEVGNQTQYIWSHRWVLNGGTKGQVRYDNVWINDYMVNPEIYKKGAITGIGVFCHEFGHNLGLPDLYDTDDLNGKSEGIGNWGVMGGGSWLGGGHQPGNFCAWSRIEYGWDSPSVLYISSSDGSYSLNPASINKDEIYKVNTPVSSEYFLLENRQKVGVDSALPGTGLAIWHINTLKTNSSGNGVNADVSLKGVDLEEADGNDDLDSSRNRGDAGDLFPGKSVNRFFNDVTYPHARNYNSGLTGLIIRNIREKNQIITFDFGPKSPGICGNDTLIKSSDTLSDRSGKKKKYSNNLSCTWLIEPTITAQSITLIFNNFKTQAIHDSVTIYDGTDNTAPIIATYSGNSIPANTSSTGGAMFIEFHTDNTVVDSGWTASYTSVAAVNGCSGTTTLTTTNGSFTDGSGAANYKNNLACKWQISPVNNPATITWGMDSIDLASGDSIMVYDGTTATAANLIQTYTGTNKGTSSIATSGDMLAVFNTDGSNTSKGWGATYNTSNFSCSPHDTLKTTFGSFSDGSKSFVQYKNNIACEWLIQLANTNLIIDLNFSYFRTESINDSVTIYDGSTTAAPILGSYSGISIPSTISSTGNSMLVTFNTNGSKTDIGWLAVYTTRNKMDTLDVVQDTLFLNANLNSNNRFTLKSNTDWNITNNASWMKVNPMSGNKNASPNCVAIQANTGLERSTMLYAATKNNTVKDSLLVIQKGIIPQLSANPITVYLNSTASSHDVVNVQSNLNWTVTNPASWLSLSKNSGSNNDDFTVTANSANMSGSTRTAKLTISAIGISDQYVYVNQIDGSKASFAVSTDTVYLDSAQGSKGNFTVLATSANWTLTESSPWLLVNPISGTQTETINLLTSSKNVYGNPRYAKIKASDPVLGDTTVVVVQKASAPLFEVSRSTIFLKNVQGDYRTFNVSSNLQQWMVSENKSWMKVSPLSGSFTKEITVIAIEDNNTKVIRTGIITVSAPPLVAKTIIVSQDTLRQVGLSESELQEHLMVYPNPSKGIVNIEMDKTIDPSNLKLKVYNSVGVEVLLSAKVESSKIISFDFSQLASGFYFLTIDYDGNRESRKISIIGN